MFNFNAFKFFHTKFYLTLNCVAGTFSSVIIFVLILVLLAVPWDKTSKSQYECL